MPESGEWFSPRTRPEMLTSDDPPVPSDEPELVQILPGPGTVAGRAMAPLRQLVAFIPAIGRRIVRVDDEPSRWQLAGMWATGSAIVAATGLAVAAVLGGAPPALTQPFERLAVLPGISDPHAGQKTVTSADEARGDDHSAPARQRASSRSDGSGSFSSGRDVVTYPEDLVPGRPLSATSPGSSGSGTVSGGGSTAAGGGSTAAGGGSTAAGGGSGSTAPAPPAGGGATTPPVTSPTTPVSEPTQEPPTEPSTPTAEPTVPAPTQEPTNTATPTDSPTTPDNPPTDEPALPTTDPPVADTPDDPAPPTESVPTDPAPAPTTP